MTKRVLNVGQCNPDHASISRFLTMNFRAAVDRADELDETLEMLRAKSYDLVLINRKLDIDYSDGMRILKTLKADEEFREIPVMIVSNYADAQEAAVAAGAARGFGKAELGHPDTVARVGAVLGENA